MNFVRLNLRLILRLGILLLPLAGVAFAQQPAPFVVEPPPNAAYPDYGPGNATASRLRRQPAKMFSFDRASLRDTLRYLADDAGIPFVGIPESDAANRQLVTFTMEASPFVALESVCRDNGVRLTYDNGVWYMHTMDEERERRLKEEDANKLIGKVYHLRYDPVDRVDFKDSTSTPTQSTTSATSIPLQNSQRIFQSLEPRIVNEIRSMLGLTRINYNKDGTMKDEQTAGGTTQASTSPLNSEKDLTVTRSVATAGGGSVTTQGLATDPARAPLNLVYVPPQTPQVIYNSDNNTLWVVATVAQHKWVVDYLQSVDLPQDLIAIEVKFFETTRDPSKELGINWSGTMAGGYTVALRDIKAVPNGSIDFAQGRAHYTESGYGQTAGGISSGGAGGLSPTEPGKLPTIPGASIGGGIPNGGQEATLSDSWKGIWGKSVTAAAPYSAVLTAGDLALTLQAFMNDQKTSMVQYPRVLTVNNREVAISSAVNTPILSSSQTTGSGGTSTSTQQVNYLPIGTQINILPKTVGKEDIAMSVAITISSYVSDKIIAGNNYPITASRIYNAALQVKQGYTLAVGGLESTDDSRKNNGIPLLQDIPGVGEFFKSKTRTRNKKNLIVFITPTRIENPKATRGISETPESVIPIRPNDPTPPAFTPDGQLVGGYDAINAAFAWLDFQIKWFKQVNKENRTDRESIKQLRAVIASARMLVRDIARMQETADPARANELARLGERAVATLTELNRVLSVAQNNLM